MNEARSAALPRERCSFSSTRPWESVALNLKTVAAASAAAAGLSGRHSFNKEQLPRRGSYSW